MSLIGASNITDFATVDEAVFVAFLDSNDSELISLYKSMAYEKHLEFTFGLATTPDFPAIEGLQVPSVVCYKARYGERDTLPGPFDKASLQRFVRDATRPAIGEMTRRNVNDYMRAGKPIAYIFAETERERDHLRLSLRPVAKRYSEYVNFVTVDATEHAQMAIALDLKPGLFPAVVLHAIHVDQTFPFDQRRKITPEAIDEHVLAVAQGRGTPGPLPDDEELSHEEL